MTRKSRTTELSLEVIPFSPLMCKDEEGLRPSQRDNTRGERPSLHMSVGEQLPMKDRSTNIHISDAPALYVFPRMPAGLKAVIDNAS